MSVTEAPRKAEMTRDERRELVQASARSSLGRRRFFSGATAALVGFALLLAFIPLGSILWNVLTKGAPFITKEFLTTPQAQPDFAHPNAIGGISNAITGTLLVMALSLLISIPLSILLSMALYEASGRLMRLFRMYVQIMTGLPSILLGVFIFIFMVEPLSYHYCALAGVFALSIMMIPVMTIACEDALRDVPATLNEAGLALGARKSRVMMRVLFPFALPRMLTGILLSLSRAVGETAPLLLVIGASLTTNWNPLAQVTTLPTLIFNYLNGTFPAQQEACWGIAFVLIVAVLTLNILSRVIVARTNRGRR